MNQAAMPGRRCKALDLVTGAVRPGSGFPPATASLLALAPGAPGGYDGNVRTALNPLIAVASIDIE